MSSCVLGHGVSVPLILNVLAAFVKCCWHLLSWLMRRGIPFIRAFSSCVKYPTTLFELSASTRLFQQKDSLKPAILEHKVRVWRLPRDVRCLPFTHPAARNSVNVARRAAISKIVAAARS